MTFFFFAPSSLSSGTACIIHAAKPLRYAVLKETIVKEFTYKIRQKEGLHARPAGMLIKKANEFDSTIELIGKGNTLSLKGGIFSIISLGLGSGDEMKIRCQGADEEAAAAAMSKLVSALF